MEMEHRDHVARLVVGNRCIGVIARVKVSMAGYTTCHERSASVCTSISDFRLVDAYMRKGASRWYSVQKVPLGLNVNFIEG